MKQLLVIFPSLFIFLFSLLLLDNQQTMNGRKPASGGYDCFEAASDFDIYEGIVEYSDNYASFYARESEVAFVQFEIDDNELNIIQIEVDEAFRGKGIQNKLYEKILDENSDIKKMTGNLSMKNEEIFYKGLIESFGEKSSDDMDFESFYKECCREKYLALSIDEQEDIFLEAIEETPWYKSRVNYGFFEFCSKNSFSEFKETGLITASMCRY